MTKTATGSKSITDEEILSGLDFEFEESIPCDHDGCHPEAVDADVKLTLRCCKQTFFLCEECLFIVLKNFNHMLYYYCHTCEFRFGRVPFKNIYQVSNLRS